MKTALHPFENRKTTLFAHASEFGGKLDARWRNTERPRARCPACEAGLSIMGEDRPVHDRHFRTVPEPAPAHSRILPITNTHSSPIRIQILFAAKCCVNCFLKTGVTTTR